MGAQAKKSAAELAKEHKERILREREAKGEENVTAAKGETTSMKIYENGRGIQALKNLLDSNQKISMNVNLTKAASTATVSDADDAAVLNEMLRDSMVPTGSNLDPRTFTNFHTLKGTVGKVPTIDDSNISLTWKNQAGKSSTLPVIGNAFELEAMIAHIVVDKQILAGADYDALGMFMDIVRSKMNLILMQTIMSNQYNTSIAFKGIIPNLDPKNVVDNVGPLSFPEVIKTFTKIKSYNRSNASWLIGEPVSYQFLSLQDGSNRPIWLYGLNENEPDRLIGKPVRYVDSEVYDNLGNFESEVDFDAANGTYTDIVVGDMKKYWLGIHQDTEVVIDTITGAGNDLLNLYITMRGAGMPLDKKAFAGAKKVEVVADPTP
jgi:HK97 family phage major capsid protein